ncbi:MAG: type II toxin-antitoxin system RelE/ParE family toxin [Roseiarcus sp.]
MRIAPAIFRIERQRNARGAASPYRRPAAFPSVAGGTGRIASAGASRTLPRQTQLPLDSHHFVAYKLRTIEVRQSPAFTAWFKSLRDRQARARIAARLARLQSGNLGDVAPIGEGVSELRIFHGPGYRVYLIQRGAALAILLCGGDKRSQEADIPLAKKLAKEYSS